MTRSLGDFFMQWHGATREPSVSCIDLLDVTTQLDNPTLLLGSDGLWDLRKYKDVLQYPLQAPPGTPLLESLAKLVEDTRKQGDELFGESADNITAIIVNCDLKDLGMAT